MLVLGLVRVSGAEEGEAEVLLLVLAPRGFPLETKRQLIRLRASRSGTMVTAVSSYGLLTSLSMAASKKPNY